MIGENGLEETLNRRGFFHSDEDGEEVIAVVAGLDRQVTFEILRKASHHIRSGVLFLGTNPDRSFPTPKGLIPGAGAILAALEAATDIKAIIIGKPQPDMYQLALNRLGTSPGQTLVVGDRLETDIAGAQAIGCKTGLVLSGVADEQAALAWRPKLDYIEPDLTTFNRKTMTKPARKFIFDLAYDDLVHEIKELGESNFRAAQIWRGLYKDFWSSPEEFTTLSQGLRETLAQRFDFSHLQPTKWINSSNGETHKTLFLIPGQQSVETVLMRYEDRRTLCISTQAGCAMGCVFCATGQMGFRRNLTDGEITEQVIYFARQLAAQGEKVTNVVVMGMGEPFHNYDATMAAIDRLNDPKGFDFGARRFTISTVGLVPGIRRFANERRQVNLAISLHASDDQTRSSLLPMNKKYPIAELMDACLRYVELTKRRITFEWALIQGVNDSIEQAQKLAYLLSPFNRSGAAMCHVNVIPLNPTNQYSGKATTRKDAFLFKATLESKGFPCTVRIRRGIDIQAGCGQLITE